MPRTALQAGRASWLGADARRTEPAIAEHSGKFPLMAALPVVPENAQVRLHLGHIKDKSLGGADELSNLRALCSTCNQGAKNVTSEKPSSIWLLSQIRRAGREEQKAVFDWLRTKFD